LNGAEESQAIYQCDAVLDAVFASDSWTEQPTVA
jgi:hypothetical protein